MVCISSKVRNRYIPVRYSDPSALAALAEQGSALMPRLDRLADNGGADTTGRAGHENAHRKFLHSFGVGLKPERRQKTRAVAPSSTTLPGHHLSFVK